MNIYKPLDSWLEYLRQDQDHIRDNNLPEKELKSLRLSGWMHQIILAPLFVPLLIGTVHNFSQDNLFYSWIEGSSSLALYSIYIRYGVRRLWAGKKLKDLKKSRLEEKL